MDDWHLAKADLKKYPHFDPLVSAQEAEAYATDSSRVARHAFFPLIQYSLRWLRFAKKGHRRVPKKRPIRYAARLDSYILSFYRHALSRRYETELKRLGIESSVLAYRQIRTSSGTGGKCNIDFAHEAFLKIRELGNCCAIALDISSYFESLDHSKLKSLWCRLISVSRLPVDHFKVFNAATKYAWVEKEELYERFGHFGDKVRKDGSTTKGYITPFRRIPKFLCSGKEFREKVAGKGSQKSIINRNYKAYGIPQGIPISDLLANLYLIDFDTTVSSWVRDAGGAYFRYSDDILILTPGGEASGKQLMAQTCDLIRKFGDKLEIKDAKSSLVVYEREGSEQKSRLVSGTKGKNGLEYLGFRYDGKKIYLRDSTISNLRRKIARAAHGEAEACAKRYPDKNATQLKKLFVYERLLKRFGRVEDFGETNEGYRSWTFWTYATRASKVFGKLGKPILRQLRKQRELIYWRADQALESAVIRRQRRQDSRRKRLKRD